jgi:hypothetical protein
MQTLGMSTLEMRRFEKMRASIALEALTDREAGHGRRRDTGEGATAQLRPHRIASHRIQIQIQIQI